MNKVVSDPEAQIFASRLRECAKSQEFAQGDHIHRQIIASPRHRHDRFLHNLTITMYGKCGRIDDAIRVFHIIPRKNLYTWSSIITAFAENGHFDKAVDFYTDMVRGSNLRPDSVVFVAVLSALSSLPSVREIHGAIVAAGIHRQARVATALVNAYGRLGSVEESLAAFRGIDPKDVVAWNSILAVVSQHGDIDRAMALYRRMEAEGAVEPDHITLASLLDGCGMLDPGGGSNRERHLEIGRTIEEESVRRGLRHNVAVENSLIRMYGRFRMPDHARSVFAAMTSTNLASWNAIIAANAQNGHRDEAIQVLESMIAANGVMPDRASFTGLLDSCSGSEHLADGVKIHGLVSSAAIDLDIVLKNALITMYGKCAGVEQASKIFVSMSVRDLVSWTAIIGANAYNGYLSQSRVFYLEMLQEGVLPDRVTFATLLGACLRQRWLDLGRMIHVHLEILYGTSLADDNLLGSHLVNFYRRCGCLDEAKEVFDQLTRPDSSSWSAMIASYAQGGHRGPALDLFQRMTLCGVSPDRMAVASVVGICWSLEHGREFHAWIRRSGLAREKSIATALIQMYGRLGCLEGSKMVFDRLEEVDAAAWTSLIQAYARNDRPQRALEVFSAMIRDGRCKPDSASFASAMDACGDVRDLDLAREIHARAMGKPEETIDIVAGNAAIAMYGKCQSLEEARAVFDRIKSGIDTGSYNAMIGAYVQNGQPAAGLELYQRMKAQGFRRDRATLVLALEAVAQASSGDEGIGREVLDDAAEEPGDEKIATAAMGVLSRAGRTSRAKTLFDSVPERDGICWSAMVTAYAQNGHSLQALEMFSAMVNDGYGADRAVVVSALAACSQSGDFSRARCCFGSMQADFGVDPAVEHYACVIDLLSRIGWIRESQELAREMPFKADRAAAMALLAGTGFAGRTACVRKFERRELEESMGCAAPYVLLSNIYKQL